MAMNHRLLRPRASGRFLLDQFGGAAVAYSLRRLRTGYAGAVVRVRRSSDSAEEDFTPEQVASGNLASWVGAGNDGFVTKWYDQSQNGNYLEQSTAASQPVVVSSGSLVVDQSLPAVSFVPNDYMLTSQSVNLGTDLSLFIVAKLTRNHTDFSRLINGMNDVFLYVGTDITENILTGHGNGSSWSAITAQTATKWLNETRLVTSVNDGNDSQWINGVSSGSRASAIGNFNAKLSVGGYYFASGGFQFNQMWQGTVSEFVVFPTARLAERAAIESNINSYFGIF